MCSFLGIRGMFPKSGEMRIISGKGWPGKKMEIPEFAQNKFFLYQYNYMRVRWNQRKCLAILALCVSPLKASQCNAKVDWICAFWRFTRYLYLECNCYICWIGIARENEAMFGWEQSESLIAARRRRRRRMSTRVWSGFSNGCSAM